MAYPYNRFFRQTWGNTGLKDKRHTDKPDDVFEPVYVDESKCTCDGKNVCKSCLAIEKEFYHGC